MAPFYSKRQELVWRAMLVAVTRGGGQNKKSMKGILGFDSRMLVYHNFFIYAGTMPPGQSFLMKSENRISFLIKR